MTSNKEMTNEQLIRELEEYDADELTGLLGITSTEIIAAFPDHVDAYLVALHNAELEDPWADDDEDHYDIDEFLDDEEEDDDAPF